MDEHFERIAQKKTLQQLDRLKIKIDTSSGALDFSVAITDYKFPPSEDTYRDACRYAHVRYLKSCDYVNWLYDHIRKMRRQTLLNKAKVDGVAVRMAALASTAPERIEGVPQLKIGDETWIQASRKGKLQGEIWSAVFARRKLETERDRLLPLSEEATGAERASRA